MIGCFKILKNTVQYLDSILSREIVLIMFILKKTNMQYAFTITIVASWDALDICVALTQNAKLKTIKRADKGGL